MKAQVKYINITVCELCYKAILDFLFDIKCLRLGLYGGEKLLFSLLRQCPDP